MNCNRFLSALDPEVSVPVLDPSTLSSLSHKTVWWKCPRCGYEWQSQIKTRTISHGSCPKCRKVNNKKVPVSDIPELSKFWGDNPNLDPEDVSSYSKQVVNWQCPDCGYTWSSQVFSQFTLKSGCPACNHQVASENYNALTEYPDLARYYDPDALDNPKLEDLLPASRKIVNWRCPTCGYEWIQPLHERIKRINGKHRVAECPVCAGISVKGVNNNLMTDYPAVAEEWDTEKNGKQCDGIRADSTANYWWKCPLGHSYYMSPKTKVEYFEANQTACPYCDDRRIFPGLNSLKALYPDLMEEWDDISNYALLDPDTIGPASEEDAWWICPNGHSYKMRIRHRVMFAFRKYVACPYCKGINKKKSHFYKR